ncbi:diguanylate cyclase (GGDEF)-like protein/PAS domain S-box-containing protein [Loktanella ponticola]|uniref:Diguanylate cyclase (GGDEF)-like protein/PAS domain S-box-containing protein n=1 Tax=Yoonia ponticola TaxID=1524255 RepID=A0A7W9BMC3_9RHOB|nr:EAL domain-containing protein [Yoonia ponticola]MBB5723169.1 diguanylate cyclase (GGDEF)-like protein/PAS domain S-box-containing protein [Yoonia ponticola]
MKQHRFAFANQRPTPASDLDVSPLISDASYYRAIGMSADVGLLVQSMDGRILWANETYAQMLVLPLDKIIGRNPLEFALSPENKPSDAEIAAFKFKPHARGKSRVSIYQNQRGNGEDFWVELHVSFDKIREYGDVAITVTREITDHITRQMELTATTAKLARLAATDSLTGLSNRLNIMNKMAQALAAPKRTGRGVGLLEIDLDHFKSINDGFGHSAGDAMLNQIADTLRSVISKDDIAARIGGDEFLMLFPNAKSLSEIEDIGNKIITLNDQTMQINGAALQCGMSIGAAFAQEDRLSPEDLLKRADFALYEAKNGGRDRVAPYDKTLHARQVAESHLADELRLAVANDEIAFQFQPIMQIKSGAISSFETLARWNNLRLGLISPENFLPLAKSLGLLAAIDFAALRAALDLKVMLNANGHADIRVGINGSAELLAHPTFFDTLISEVNARNLTPTDVMIEVLETVVFDDISKNNPLVQTVQRLHDAGIATHLDDFGTGHAGLTHLATLAVNGVKIDRTLTQNILTDSTSAKIIAMMFELCRDLDLSTVTEGIETTEQAQAIANMGGCAIQGYWLARAMPAPDVINWLATRPNVSARITSSPIAAAASPRY